MLPVTFFAVTLELPESAVTLEIWNRGTGTRLASLDLDRSVPEVRLESEVRGDAVRLYWRAQDREQSPLSYTVTIGLNETDRWPVADGLTETELVLSTAGLAPGEYSAEVMALNSIRVGKSNPVTFRVERPKH